MANYFPRTVYRGSWSDVKGNGELISGFSLFQFTQEPSGQWTYTLPAPFVNSLPVGKLNTFRHLVAYNGQRLLLDQVYGQNAGVFTSDYGIPKHEHMCGIMKMPNERSGKGVFP